MKYKPRQLNKRQLAFARIVATRPKLNSNEAAHLAGYAVSSCHPIAQRLLCDTRIIKEIESLKSVKKKQIIVRTTKEQKRTKKPLTVTAPTQRNLREIMFQLARQQQDLEVSYKATVWLLENIPMQPPAQLQLALTELKNVLN